MTDEHETIHRMPIPEAFHSFLVSSHGSFLSFSQDGGFATTTQTNDSAIWDKSTNSMIRHTMSGHELDLHQAQVTVSINDEPQSFKLVHGPEKLPSEYLQTLHAQGWVCLTQIIDDATLEELEWTACTDRHADRTADRSVPAICQNAAVARTAAEPLSLWLIRQYMQTDDIRLSHVPGFAVLGKDDGKRNVQGWHSDFPYHWGVPARGLVPTPSGKTVLGVQRNVCVSPFTRNGGATIFKLGSHAKDCAPPRGWGDATMHAKPGYRAAHGLPYGGPEADVIEAPGGSIILYDSRTWHRAGVNRTEKKRAAMLQAMTPMYIFPKNDTSQTYKRLLEAPVYEELNVREKQEIQNLMVHQFIGPGGEYAIGPDRELTDSVKSSTSSGY
ncbi:MAG: hypothetical protein F4W90_12290 [Gammaproteobacteria bacterium]|nr:hypothetical protein [Gammaproteobacteria bacterium]